MVYFGPKRYRPQRVGPTTRERAKILGSLALLLVLILTVWSMQRPEPEPSLTIPVMSSGSNDDGGLSADNTDSLGGSSSEGEVPEPVSLPSPDQGPPAEPFQENPAVLYAVRDGDAKVEGPAELAGLHYLLHRWRSDWQPEEITEPPEVSEIASQAAFMRGRRCLFVITLIENPRLRILEDNPSGLTSIWEAFGSDRSNRLHRINFISKPKNLPRSSEVLVTGDFLRLYRYETVTGMDGMVPEWVCGKLEPYESPFAGRSYWAQEMFWALSGIGVLTLLVGVFFYSRSTVSGQKTGSSKRSSTRPTGKARKRTEDES